MSSLEDLKRSFEEKDSKFKEELQTAAHYYETAMLEHCGIALKRAADIVDGMSLLQYQIQEAIKTRREAEDELGL